MIDWLLIDCFRRSMKTLKSDIDTIINPLSLQRRTVTEDMVMEEDTVMVALLEVGMVMADLAEDTGMEVDSIKHFNQSHRSGLNAAIIPGKTLNYWLKLHSSHK